MNENNLMKLEFFANTSYAHRSTGLKRKTKDFGDESNHKRSRGTTATLIGDPVAVGSPLTAGQIHEQTMAKLEIEKLDRENRRLELEVSSQRARQQYEESMMRTKIMLKLATGKDENGDT